MINVKSAINKVAVMFFAALFTLVPGLAFANGEALGVATDNVGGAGAFGLLAIVTAVCAALVVAMFFLLRHLHINDNWS